MARYSWMDKCLFWTANCICPRASVPHLLGVAGRPTLGRAFLRRANIARDGRSRSGLVREISHQHSSFARNRVNYLLPSFSHQEKGSPFLRKGERSVLVRLMKRSL